jgi:hypothetical protein
MKIRMIKVAFVLALIGSGGALSLASGIDYKSQVKPVEMVTDSSSTGMVRIEDMIIHKLSYRASGHFDLNKNLPGIWLSTDAHGTVKVLYVKNASVELKQLIYQQLDGAQMPLCESECNKQFHFVLHYNLI